MVQGGMSVVKFLVFAFNFVFVICGIALIVVGAIAKTSGTQYTEFLGSKFLTAPAIIIALGVIIFLIAFLGCCGALNQNYCMVLTFGILLFLIFIVEISVGIAAYVYRSELDKLIKDNMEESLKTSSQDEKSVWNDMQHSLKCCGVEGYQDYAKYNYTVSLFCCKDDQEKCQTLPPQQAYYADGCYEKIKTFFKGKVAMVGGAGIGIAFIEILGIIFAWCLASAIKKEYEGV